MILAQLCNNQEKLYPNFCIYFPSFFKVLGSKNEFHFIHHGLPHARSKRSVGHLRLLKADPHVAHAFQQTGFRRVKRGFGLPKAGLSAEDLALTASKF